ncbi:MAG TPA: transporter [Kofleriaceae bacterium]|nr:transporter [Kofleriaceae bacterium]
MHLYRICAFTIAACMAAAANAQAQTCHEIPVSLGATHAAAADVQHVSLVLRNEFRAVVGGGLVGTTPQVGYQRGRYAAQVGLPMYRTAVGAAELGIGDLSIEALANVWRNQRWATAVAVVMTAPTGDSSKSMGMGHWMAMSSAALSLRTGPVTATAMIGGGKAVGAAASEHHHHHSKTGFPLVNPMNQFEANAMLRLTLATGSAVRPEAMASIALPLDDMGVTRSVVGLGFDFNQGPWRLHPSVQVGIVGKPFYARTTFDVGYAF